MFDLYHTRGSAARSLPEEPREAMSALRRGIKKKYIPPDIFNGRTSEELGRMRAEVERLLQKVNERGAALSSQPEKAKIARTILGIRAFFAMLAGPLIDIEHSIFNSNVVLESDDVRKRLEQLLEHIESQLNYNQAP